MGALLLVPYALFFLVRLGRGGRVLRALLDAAVLLAAGTLAGCELLSLPGAYRLLPLLAFWLAVCAGTVLLCRPALGRGLAALRRLRLPQLAWGEWLMLAVVAVFAAGTLATALLYPPTLNNDSLTYHMPRVFFWLKNGSVHNYPTAVARQLYVGPFAEFGILQLQVLNLGADTMANTVQWLGYLGMILAVAGIAGELGAGRFATVATALLAATVPLAVMQARNTQTDLLVTAWCAVTVYYVLWYLNHRPEKRAALEWAVFAGLAGGAAALTKNTAFAILAPFAVLLLVMAWRKTGLKQLAALAGVVAAAVLCFNAGFMVRNALDLDGNFLATGLPETRQFMLTTLSPRYRLVALAMNVLANFGSQSRVLSHWVDRLVVNLLEATGISMGDPEVFNEGVHFTSFVEYQSHDYAANPMHFALILIALAVGAVLFIVKRRSRAGHRLVLGYALCCAAAMCLVGVLIKWTVDASARYGLPALVLALGFVAIPFQRAGIRRGFLAGALLLITLNAAKPLLFDYRQPLIYSPRLAGDMNTGQPVGWFSHSRDELRLGLLAVDDPAAYVALEQALLGSGATDIGIYERVGRAIYPCLVPLAGDAYDVRYIEAGYHAEAESTAFHPQAVLAVIPLPDDPAQYTLEYNGRPYRLAVQAPTGSLCYALLLPA